jgi:hypothetical protein
LVVWEGEDRWLGVLEGLDDLVGEADAEAEPCGDGVLLAAWDGDEGFMSIGITMSAPTMKNTAAMATLESCIGSSGGDPVGDLGPYCADYPGAKGT